MNYRGVGWIVAGLLAAIGMVAMTASAQSQEITVELAGEVVEEPDELPGVYEVEILAETRASAGVCACTQTTVELDSWGPSGVRPVLSPSAYVIHWTGNHGLESAHYEQIGMTVGVSDAYQNQSVVTLEIDGDAETDTDVVTDGEVLPLEIALPIPEDEDDSEAQASASRGSEDDANGSPDREASTGIHSSNPVEAPSLDGAAVGSGVAGLALLGLAVRRLRGP